MIFERCAFIIIYISLFGLNSSSGKAVTSNKLDTTVMRDQTIFAQNVVNQEDSDFSWSKTSVQVDRRLRQSSSNRSLKLSQKYSLEQNSTDSESFQAINHRWILGAMALTTSISLFLLWLLFRKPSQNKMAVTKVALTKQRLKISEANYVSPSESVIETTTLQSNLAENNKIPSSALDLESDNSLISKKSPVIGSTVPQIDPVRELIQDLQLDDFGQNVSLKSDPTAQISRRRKAIWELTRVGDYRSIEPLLRIMPQVGEPEKSLIIEAVSRITHRAFKPINEQLFAQLQDRDPEVRLNAIRDLKNLYQFVAPAITKISQMQSDVDYQVRQTAVQTLAQLNPNPLPTFTNSAKSSVEQEINKLVSGEDSEANLHLVAYLLEELDTEK